LTSMGVPGPALAAGVRQGHTGAMTTTPCRECGQAVSLGAKACPHCKAKYPSTTKRENTAITVGVVAALALGLAICVAGKKEQEPAGPAEPRRAKVGEKTQIYGKGWHGCVDREVFEKLGALVVQRDEAAFNRAIGELYGTGECVRLYSDTAVYLTDVTMMGLARVRKEGEPAEYWTNVEAVTPPR
jgi:hypothetical protein